MVEFAAILLPMLTLLYGIIVYSIVFVAQQAVAYAAESGADAVVAVAPDFADFAGEAERQARMRVDDVLGFLPGSGATTSVSVLPPLDSASRQVIVNVNYPFPSGLSVAGILPVPEFLRAQGLVNIQLL